LRCGKQGIDQGLTPNAKLNYAWINNALLSAVLANTVSRYHLSTLPGRCWGMPALRAAHSGAPRFQS
jgi:hypothetical protein